MKKLRWAPDIIHCHGWISHILPIYLKKAYIDDPIFSGSKIVTSLYGDTPTMPFAPEFRELVKFGNITDADTELLAEPSGINLAKLAVRYSDGVIIGDGDVSAELTGFCASEGLPLLPFDASAMENGSYIDAYNRFYDSL